MTSLPHNSNDKLISVIVPVFRVESYLRRCLDSIVNQTYPHLEIILVDDGSPDRCGEICDEYARCDCRIRVIHQENSGVSAARNAGLDIATGEYIGFVDSDDFIAPEMYERLLSAMVSNSADIGFCNFYELNKTDKCVISPVKAGLTTEEYKKLIKNCIYPCSVWMRLFRKSLFTNCRFAVGRKYEDFIIAPAIHDKAGKIVCIEDVLYYYDRSNEFSIMNLTEKKLQDQYELFIAWAERTRTCFTESDEFYDYCIKGTLSMGFGLIRWHAKIPFLNDQQAGYIRSFLETYNLRKIKQFQWFLYCRSPFLFKLYSLYRLRNK